MKMLPLGKSDVLVSEQVFGTWALGGDYFGSVQDKESIEAIKSAIDNGITTIDTAAIYGAGHSEKIVGEAIKSYNRCDLQIITKLWQDSMAKDQVENALNRSLENLGTDYVDIYFIHYPSNMGIPIGDTMSALNKLKDEGKIKCIGVSNFSKEQLIEARKYGPIDVIQPCYSLLWRFLDLEEMNYCKENNIGIISYSTLAQGLLTGKFDKDKKRPQDSRSHVPLFQEPWYSKALDVTEALKPFAEKYDVTLAQLAIRWVMEQDGITAPIVGAKRSSQVTDNVQASNFSMTKEDFKKIDDLSKAYAYKLPRWENFFEAE